MEQADFNPRTPAKECDRSSSDTGPRNLDFNPRTPAKECDRLGDSVPLRQSYFNPRTPAKECDATPLIPEFNRSFISIHAPPRRSATYSFLTLSSTVLIFQSTHPREGVRQGVPNHMVIGTRNFNPRTPAKECDLLVGVLFVFEFLISIHAPPRRSATATYSK